LELYFTAFGIQYVVFILGRVLIILDFIKNSKKLLNGKFLKKHYKCLVAYLAVTAIENKPAIVDRAIVFYLRMTKRYYNNKTTYEPKIRKYI
jgi:hypothetical protein